MKINISFAMNVHDDVCVEDLLEDLNHVIADHLVSSLKIPHVIVSGQSTSLCDHSIFFSNVEKLVITKESDTKVI